MNEETISALLALGRRFRHRSTDEWAAIAEPEFNAFLCLHFGDPSQIAAQDFVGALAVSGILLTEIRDGSTIWQLWWPDLSENNEKLDEIITRLLAMNDSLIALRSCARVDTVAMQETLSLLLAIVQDEVSARIEDQLAPPQPESNGIATFAA